MNTITTKFIIEEGAQVHFENFWFRSEQENNLFTVTGGSKLSMNLVVFEHANANNSYPLFYMENESSAQINQLTIAQGGDQLTKFEIHHSDIFIENSWINESMIALMPGSKMVSENTSFTSYGNNNVFKVYQSSLSLDRSTIQGALTEEIFPALWMSESRLVMRQSNIYQAYKPASLLLKDDSYAEIEASSLTSIAVEESRLLIKQSQICEVLRLLHGSYANMAGENRFLGYLAFLDPPKESSKEALKGLKDHGVRVKVMTGDNAAVTQTIAQEVGLKASKTIEGTALEGLTDQELAQIAQDYNLFVKMTPGQKLNLSSSCGLQTMLSVLWETGLMMLPHLPEKESLVLILGQ